MDAKTLEEYRARAKGLWDRSICAGTEAARQALMDTAIPYDDLGDAIERDVPREQKARQ